MTSNQVAPDPVLNEKMQLIAELRKALGAALEVATAAAHTARAAAIHEEAKAEDDKDTRAIEAGYLAVGQSARAAELGRAMAGLSSVSDLALRRAAVVASLAIVEADETIRDEVVRIRLFLCPWGGGLKLQGGDVHVVTPQSPLGQALLGKSPGDFVEARVGGRDRALEIVDVR